MLNIWYITVFAVLYCTVMYCFQKNHTFSANDIDCNHSTAAVTDENIFSTWCFPPSNTALNLSSAVVILQQVESSSCPTSAKIWARTLVSTDDTFPLVSLLISASRWLAMEDLRDFGSQPAETKSSRRGSGLRLFASNTWRRALHSFWNVSQAISANFGDPYVLW